MIPCEHCEELINARLDGQLTDQEALLLEEHLDQCPQCRQLDRDLTALHHRLGALSAAPPADLTAAILSQLEVPAMQTKRKKKKAPWAAIACAAAAVVLMVVALTPQMFPASGDTALEAAESAEPTPLETAPQEEKTTADLAEGAAEPEAAAASLTMEEAQELLIDYLIDQGLSLDLVPGSLSEDGSFWTFTGWNMDTGERTLFSVYCSDGYIEEALLP